MFRFFDKLEDYVRGTLSRYPILYGVIGGVALVLFWRGVWHAADMIEGSDSFLAPLFTAPISTGLSALTLLMTGLFVSFFIGDRIILSGLRHEKKIEEKTEAEVRQEGVLLVEIHRKVEKIEKVIASLKKGE